MKSFLRENLERAVSFFERRPITLPRSPSSLKDFLFYEEVIEGDLPTFLLSDGSVGVMWEITTMAHESKSGREIEVFCEHLGRILGELKNPDLTMQVIFDSERSQKIPTPEWTQRPSTSAQKILAHRFQEIQELGRVAREKLYLMKRRVFLTLRLGSGESFSQISSRKPSHARMQDLLLSLQSAARETADRLNQAGLSYKVVSGRELLKFLQDTLHDVKTRSFESFEEYREGYPLKNFALQDFTQFTLQTVSVGEDSWEVASWAEQSAMVYPGMMARLLEIDLPIRVVLCVRQALDHSDLERKSFFLKRAEDPIGELQRSEIKETLDRVARGESLLGVSLHVMMRHQNKSSIDLIDGRRTLEILSKIKNLTGIPWIHERYSAAAIFFLTLPFGFSKGAAQFMGREKRILSGNLGYYAPIYGGYQGTRKSLQPMISRGGEFTTLSPFASETSPHLAILASSGGGKSFFAQNLMMSFFADFKNPLLFIIDKKTSYEIFAKVVGEDHGYQFLKPPSDYPNIFRGKLDSYRLPVIVSLLKSAVSLVSKNLVLGANEELLLSESVRLTFDQNELDAKTHYDGLKFEEQEIIEVKIPRLRDVQSNLSLVAAEYGINQKAADFLAEAMAPFVGNGPYANLFDREEFNSWDPETPGISLYDIDGVSSHPLLSTLTTQMILSEILRQITRPENCGRPGMLVIEEAGVLAGSSPEIVSFIQDAWKTFRKLGISCVGLTNEVDDYLKKPGPREIWNVSPNKVILKMTSKDLDKAVSQEDGRSPLIDDEHAVSLARSLVKKDSVYSQGLFMSDESKGTFVYMPTGFDYWCAASKPVEVDAVYQVAQKFALSKRPFFEAVSWLSKHFPRGIRDEQGEIRVFKQEDFDQDQKSLGGKLR